MRPASIKETKNGYNDENYITPRTLRAALANYSPGGGGSSEGGTTDYNKLENKPSINGVTLSQNKTLKDLGIQPEGAYLTEVPDTYKTKDENDKLYQPKGSYQPAGSYQETLVSGENIKTVNGQTLLGEGDLTIAGGGGGGLIDTLPVGTMIPYGSAETPDNWLSCNGQAVSRTTYSHLFKVIGTSYGEGDGSTTFNLPDKRGRVSVGYDPDQAMFNKVGAKVGSNTHTLTVDEMPKHQHESFLYGTWYDGGSVTTNSTYVSSTPGNASQSTVTIRGLLYKAGLTNNIGSGQAHSILQASEVDHWIIKAFPLSNPEGTLDPLPIGTIVEYDGEEIPDGFEEIQEVSTTQRWVYNTQFKYNSITNNTWSLLAPFVTTDKLPKGRYLALYNIGMYAGGTGTVTLNAGFNDSRLDADRRASIPLASGLITNTEVTHYFELEEEKTVTLSAYAYSNANCSINTFRVDIIKLDSEETGLVIDNAQEYSTEEKIIGTWIDGKPIYRKVIDFGSLPAEQGTKYINHNISNVDKFTNITVIGYEGENAFCIPHVGNAWMFAEASYSMRVNSTQVGIYVSKDRSMQTAIFTLEYTKTTD